MNCSNCSYFVKSGIHKDIENNETEHGACYRFPMYETKIGTNWCGEFLDINAKEPDFPIAKWTCSQCGKDFNINAFKDNCPFCGKEINGV